MKTKHDGRRELMEIGDNAFESIKEMVDAVENATTYEEKDDAVQRIHEDALSVEVRTGWYTPGMPPRVPEEYCILLSTGGPATRIIGSLSEHGDPETARLEAQDWGTTWTDTFQNEGVLLKYASHFCFGE